MIPERIIFVSRGITVLTNLNVVTDFDEVPLFFSKFIEHNSELIPSWHEFNKKIHRGVCIARAERDGTRAGTRFRLSPKRTSPFKSVGESVQSTAGRRGVRINLSNAG